MRPSLHNVFLLRLARSRASASPRSRRTRIHFPSIAGLLLCLCAVLPRPAAASSVVVIKESNIKPYTLAIDGFRSTCACTVREFPLSETDHIEDALKEHPAAVLTVGTKAFLQARGIRDLPLIYSMVIPSETAGPLPDNISGVSMDISPQEYVDAIIRLFPGARRIGLLYDPDNTGPFVHDAEGAAGARGITLVARQVHDPRSVPGLLNELRKKIDVFWMLPDSTVIRPDTLDYLMLFSFQNNLPVFSFSGKYLDRGAAAALTVDPFAMGAQAGRLTGLRAGGAGARREYAKGARLMVNRKLCAKLGVRLSEEISGSEANGGAEE